MADVRPFIVLALPRSRSFWLSRLLCWGGRACHHDPGRFWSSTDDALRFFEQPHAAGVDTALCLVWNRLRTRVPGDVGVMALHRPVDEVEDSLRRLGYPVRREWLERLEGALQAIDCEHIEADSLGTYDGAARVFRACHGDVLPLYWWHSLRDRNLQCDLKAYAADVRRNAAGTMAFFRQIMESAT